MGFFVGWNGTYYEGDRQTPEHQEVTERPSHLFKWDGGAWVEDAAAIKSAALSELTEMEREALMPRVTREFLITATLMQATQLGISHASLLDPLDPAFSPGFKKMWDFNQKTIELRKKL